MPGWSVRRALIRVNYRVPHAAGGTLNDENGVALWYRALTLAPGSQADFQWCSEPADIVWPGRRSEPSIVAPLSGEHAEQSPLSIDGSRESRATSRSLPWT